jgi:predicted regulator of amino acid metabolism with ACT domain
MTDSAEIVRKVIESDGAIRSGLSRGLINVRGLAKYVQQQARHDGEEFSLDAIIGAIRRHPIDQSAATHQRIGGLLMKLTMKNKIADVAVLNDPEIPAALGRFAAQVDYGRGETFRIVAGVESIRVVLDEKNLQRMTTMIPKKSVRKIVTDLAEIIISMEDIAETTPGVVSTVTTELAMNGINMIEFMSCVPELIIVVDEKDALRSYASLEKLSKRPSSAADRGLPKYC